jgi:hypothetical protein
MNDPKAGERLGLWYEKGPEGAARVSRRNGGLLGGGPSHLKQGALHGAARTMKPLDLGAGGT